MVINEKVMLNQGIAALMITPILNFQKVPLFLWSVVFSGEYTKALDLLRQADIHVLPSKLPPRSDMCDWALFDKHECSRYERQFCLDEW